MLPKKPDRRLAWIGVCLGVLLFLGIAFHSFVQQNLIYPIGMVLWLCWRVLLALDQRIYWVMLPLSGLLYLIIAMSRGEAPVQPKAHPTTNASLESLAAWRNLILLSRDEVDLFKRDLGLLLTSAYASRQPDRPQYEIYEALRSGQIALPEHIHHFLFSPDSRGHPGLVGTVRAWLAAPRR